MQPEGKLPFVTATEVAEWVFCRHSWFLRRQGSGVSDEAQARMEAGAEFQAEKDALAYIAVHSQAAAKNAARLAVYAGLAFLLLLTLWLSFSPSQR